MKKLLEQIPQGKTKNRNKMYKLTTTGTQQHITAHNSVQEFSDYKKAVEAFFKEVDRFDDIEERPEWPETEQPLTCDCRDYIVRLWCNNIS